MKKSLFRVSNLQIIALGYFVMIMIGATLLTLPISSNSNEFTPFSDALFTSTSASCVTGLVVLDTAVHWSLFGQIVILSLIQIGGLGFMTIAFLFFILMKKRLGLRKREVLIDSINHDTLGGLVPFVKKIILGTLICESVGALLLMIRFIPEFGVSKGIYYSIFHSISAFCNAGFDLMGVKEPYSSLVSYSDDILVNVVIMSLITIGGIGFLVWNDVVTHKFRFKRYRLHSKIVLLASLFLILIPAILFFFLERENLSKYSLTEQILRVFFDSISPRTAGFNTSDIGSLTQGGKLLTIILMFIGGSPGSTAGGIKTTTLVIILFTAFNVIRHNEHPAIFGRSLSSSLLRKSVCILVINFSLTLTGIFLIAAMQDINIIDIILETVSAIGTVGMSSGITRDLNIFSRYIIIFLMFCGRVGSMSFAIALLEKKAPPPITYPEENIMIG